MKEFKELIVEKSLPSFPNIRIPVMLDVPETENLLNFFVSAGEYPTYTDDIYDYMEEDNYTEKAYNRALEKLVKGKSVLDIGTGKYMDWAIESLRRGAAKATGIEGQKDTYKKALKVLAKDKYYKNYLDRLNLVNAWSSDYSPKEKFDVIISEVIGSIGGSEGAEEALRDAFRLLSPEGKIIPSKCFTMASAVCLKDHMPYPAFNQYALEEMDAIFNFVGYPFDIRLMMNYRRPDMLLTNIKSVETLFFGEKSPLPKTEEVLLTFKKACRFDGLFLWVNLYVEEDSKVIDSLHQQTGWDVVYIPLYETPVEVKQGEKLYLSVFRELSEDKIHPNYFFSNQVLTVDGFPKKVRKKFISSYFQSFYRQPLFRENFLYKQLFKIKIN